VWIVPNKLTEINVTKIENTTNDRLIMVFNELKLNLIHNDTINRHDTIDKNAQIA